MKDDDFVFTREKSKGDDCKGLFFRGYHSAFAQDGHIGIRQGVKLLKRMSCRGCDECGYLWDDAVEANSCGSLIVPEIEHGALYQLRITNISKDWETGYADDWDTELVKVDAMEVGGESNAL